MKREILCLLNIETVLGRSKIVKTATFSQFAINMNSPRLFGIILFLFGNTFIVQGTKGTTWRLVCVVSL